MSTITCRVRPPADCYICGTPAVIYQNAQTGAASLSSMMKPYCEECKPYKFTLGATTTLTQRAEVDEAQLAEALKRLDHLCWVTTDEPGELVCSRCGVQKGQSHRVTALHPEGCPFDLGILK